MILLESKLAEPIPCRWTGGSRRTGHSLRGWLVWRRRSWGPPGRRALPPSHHSTCCWRPKRREDGFVAALGLAVAGGLGGTCWGEARSDGSAGGRRRRRRDGSKSTGFELGLGGGGQLRPGHATGRGKGRRDHTVDANTPVNKSKGKKESQTLSIWQTLCFFLGFYRVLPSFFICFRVPWCFHRLRACLAISASWPTEPPPLPWPPPWPLRGTRATARW